jgi:hypothetical protein
MLKEKSEEGRRMLTYADLNKVAFTELILSVVQPTSGVNDID